MKKRPKKQDYILNECDLEKVKNAMELQVIKAMKELLPKNKKYDSCPICTEDIYALSLNRLQPCYEQVGTIVLKKKVNEEEVRDVVQMTIEQIVNRPNHR